MFTVSTSEPATREKSAATAADPQHHGSTSSGDRKLVLLVDDDPLTRVVMSTRTREAGFSVETASIVPFTVERAGQLRPDLVVVNLNLHEKAGLELLRDLRKVIPSASIPVFALSDTRAGRIENKAQKLGLTRVFRTTGSRPQEVIKAIIDWFSPQPQREWPAAASHPAGPATPARAQSSLTQPPAPASVETIESRIAGVRRELQAFARCTRLTDHPKALTNLLSAIDALTPLAQATNRRDLAVHSAALAGLVRELVAKPSGMTPAMRRTLAQSIDFLQVLGAAESPSTHDSLAGLTADIIENNSAQRTAIASALAGHGFKPRAFQDPSSALQQLENSHTDLVIINVTLPGACGYDIATTIREMPRHEATPLLFMTTLGDFAGSSYVVLHGGSDLIAEPFLPAELVLKALLLALKNRSKRTLPSATPPAQPATLAQETVVSPLPAFLPSDPEPRTDEVSSESLVNLPPVPSMEPPPLLASDESSAAECATFFVDDAWSLCSSSDAGAAILGCPTAELAGRNLREWIILGLPATPAEATEAQAGLNHDDPQASISLILRRQNGMILPARLCLQKSEQSGDARWMVALETEAEEEATELPALPTAAYNGIESCQELRATDPGATRSQPAMLLQRLDELLTISTDDDPPAATPATGESVLASTDVSEAILELEEPTESLTCPDTPAPQDVAKVAIETAPPVTTITSPPSMPIDSDFVSAPPEEFISSADDAPAPAPQPIEAETMKPNPEAVPQASTSAWSLADVNATLNSELAEIRQLNSRMEESAAELEARLHDSMTALATATAQAQREQSERRRQEQRAAGLSKRLEELHEDLKQHIQSEEAAREKLAALETQLNQRSEAEAQTLADLEREIADKMTLREELTSADEVNQALREQIRHLESTTEEFRAIQNDLENRLQAGAAELAETSEKAAREMAERTRLETLLSKVRAEAEAEARKSAVELARLRAALQAETLHRGRLESEAMQSRGKVGEAERASASALSRFQQRVRTPVSTLVQSVGRLLEQDLTTEQREAAESLLANAALVQTCLQDIGNGFNRRQGVVTPSASPTSSAEAESSAASMRPGISPETLVPSSLSRATPIPESAKQF